MESSRRLEGGEHIAVIGGGSWGTGFAWLLGQRGHKVLIYAREPEVVEGINSDGTNPLFSAGVKLPPCVKATGSIAEALDGARFAAVAVPSGFLPGTIEALRAVWQENTTYLCLTKGLSGNPPDFISAFLEREWPELSPDCYAVLSGPNLAGEVVEGKPTAAVVASRNADLACAVQRIVSGKTFRVYTSGDVLGVEIGGSVKNIIALAAGILEGLKLGVNARSVLITRGLVEMSRFAGALGARAETVMGLSGLGDLVTTCSSTRSRNFTVGIRLAQGERIEEITASMRMVAEGIDTTRAVRARSRTLGIEMPITEEVYLVIEEGKPPDEALRDLMARTPKAE